MRLGGCAIHLLGKKPQVFVTVPRRWGIRQTTWKCSTARIVGCIDGLARTSENLPVLDNPLKVTLGPACEERHMSYAEAKQIALLRLELRACCARQDRAGADAALARLGQAAGNDNELAAEVRRWAAKLAA
jgi:hypothetical protein